LLFDKRRLKLKKIKKRLGKGLATTINLPFI
jgi:hypothetical protein